MSTDAETIINKLQRPAYSLDSYKNRLYLNLRHTIKSYRIVNINPFDLSNEHETPRMTWIGPNLKANIGKWLEWYPNTLQSHYAPPSTVFTYTESCANDSMSQSIQKAAVRKSQYSLQKSDCKCSCTSENLSQLFSAFSPYFILERNPTCICYCPILLY